MHRYVAKALLLALLVCPAAASASDIFSAANPDAAHRQAEDLPGDRIIVVYFVEPGSTDCAWMDNETWGAGRVQQWVRNHAVAVKMDMSQGPGKRLAARHGLYKAPSVIAYKHGHVVKQNQGVMDAQSLLDWLEVVRVGQARAGQILSEHGAPDVGPEGELDFERRMVVALELQGAGRMDLAGRELAGLWMLSMGTAQQEARRPLVAQAMRPLIEADYDAKHHISLARDASWVRYKKYKSTGDLVDWLTLNQLLGESSVTLRWVTEARQTEEGREAMGKLLDHPQDPLMAMLVREGMWVTIGRSIKDPIQAVESRELEFRRTKVSITGQISESDRTAHRRLMSIIAGSLLAAERERDGRAVAEHILTLDKKAGPSLVKTALEIGEPRRWHRAFLNPGHQDQVQIALELSAALRNK